jgi:hypothetical protein
LEGEAERMLTESDLQKIKEIIHEEVYGYKEGKISLVTVATDVSKILEGFIFLLLQIDKAQAQFNNFTDLLKQYTMPKVKNDINDDK